MTPGAWGTQEGGRVPFCERGGTVLRRGGFTFNRRALLGLGFSYRVARYGGTANKTQRIYERMNEILSVREVKRPITLGAITADDRGSLRQSSSTGFTVFL